MKTFPSYGIASKPSRAAAFQSDTSISRHRPDSSATLMGLAPNPQEVEKRDRPAISSGERPWAFNFRKHPIQRLSSSAGSGKSPRDMAVGTMPQATMPPLRM